MTRLKEVVRVPARKPRSTRVELILTLARINDTIPPVHPSRDAREALRQECWKAYYSAYYSQLLADLVAGRWQKLDQVSKLLIALFTTGSAIAGWSLWTNTGPGKVIWLIGAGIAAV